MTNPAFAIHRVMHAEPFRVLLIKEQISAVCTQANILICNVFPCGRGCERIIAKACVVMKS